MALINTAASCTNLTKTAPATTTMHAVDLLLWNLPPEARLGHRLPGLANNILSVAALVDAGCEVSFIKSGAKSSSTGPLSSKGGGTPRLDCGG
jgi:hypothetical protein